MEAFQRLDLALIYAMDHTSYDFDWYSIYYFLLPLEQPVATITLDDDTLRTKIQFVVVAAELAVLSGHLIVERAVRRL